MMIIIWIVIIAILYNDYMILYNMIDDYCHSYHVSDS